MRTGTVRRGAKDLAPVLQGEQNLRVARTPDYRLRVPTIKAPQAMMGTAQARLCPHCKMILQLDWVRRVGKGPCAAPAIGIAQAMMKTLAPLCPPYD